jgi:hypothetical protein
VSDVSGLVERLDQVACRFAVIFDQQNLHVAGPALSCVIPAKTGTLADPGLGEDDVRERAPERAPRSPMLVTTWLR